MFLFEFLQLNIACKCIYLAFAIIDILFLTSKFFANFF